MSRQSSTFTPDITPLILGAHKNNYEILKMLLDRGASLPMPHDIKCGCDECVTSSEQDSLRHSQARINAYRALSASSLIALSSRDPVLTSFELSAELRRLSSMETEFRSEYNVSWLYFQYSLSLKFLRGVFDLGNASRSIGVRDLITGPC
jgi:transient receptor potential cation channel subfamily C member 4